MVKKIKKIGICFLTCLFLCALPMDTALAGAALNNSGTRPEASDSKKKQDTSVYEILPGFEKIAESHMLELFLEQDTLSLQVREKGTGEIYSSFVEHTKGLNDIWQKFIRSGVTVEYMSKDNKLTKMSSANPDVKKKIKKEKNGFTAELTFEHGISLSLVVTAKDNCITLEVPEGSIKETEKDFKLENIYIYPFLGASVGTEVPGYLFVPDGCGALMRTDRQSTATSGLYSKRMYGMELGTADYNQLFTKSELNQAEQIYVPVYGSILETGKKGIASIIEEGDAYSMIEASVSGKETPVNYVTSKFMIREPYTRYLDKKGKTMVANQKEPNQTGIKEQFYFLTGEEADYVGIAKVYRNYLKETGSLKAQEVSQSADIPLTLEILLAENKSQLMGHKPQIMTTWQDTDDILKDLKVKGIDNIDVLLRGFSKQGASAATPLTTEFQSKTGSREDWRKMIETYEKQGIDIGFYGDFSMAVKGNKDYSPKKDAALSISENLLETWYSYFLSPKYTKEKFEKEASKLKQAGASLVAVDTAGYQLYSNWNKNAKSSRSESKELMEQMQADGINTAYYRPNSYLWKQTAAIYDMPMSSSQYLVFTDTVPFLQMVLKGEIPYFAPASNFNADTRQDILAMVEYGAYPSYFVTKEDPVKLLDTASEWLYTSKYDSWKKRIEEEYETQNSVLKQVEGAYMTDREVLAEGVVKVIYSNGTALGVNYTQQDYEAKGIQIKAEDFCVIGN